MNMSGIYPRLRFSEEHFFYEIYLTFEKYGKLSPFYLCKATFVRNAFSRPKLPTVDWRNLKFQIQCVGNY